MPDLTHRARPRPRFVPLRTLALWLGVLAVLAGAGSAVSPEASAAASAAGSDHRQHAPSWKHSLTGTWDVVVTIHTPDGPTTAKPRFEFHEDQTLSAAVPANDGQEPFPGTGFWQSGRHGSFTFYIDHPGSHDDPDNGRVEAIHTGRLRGDSFTTSAYAFVTQPDGSLQGPINVTAEGTRVPSDP